MHRRLMYVEQYTGANHDGPAWIGFVQFSRTWTTAYFNGLCLQGGKGMTRDAKDGTPYWVSGVKKRGSNRHVFGRGKVLVARDALADLLELKSWDALDERHYALFDPQPTDIAAFDQLANTPIDA